MEKLKLKLEFLISTYNQPTMAHLIKQSLSRVNKNEAWRMYLIASRVSGFGIGVYTTLNDKDNKSVTIKYNDEHINNNTKIGIVGVLGAVTGPILLPVYTFNKLNNILT